MKRRLWLVLSVLVCVVAACSQSEDSPSPTPTWESPFYVPSGFPSPVYAFNPNKLTQNGFELGRRLFYDPILSIDSTVACASCHKQFSGFADIEHPISHGVKSRLGNRNTPALSNIAWMRQFAWDGGANHIEVFPIIPITKEVEMAQPLDTLVKRLQRHKFYPSWFKDAFGSDSITTQKVFYALAQFLCSMVSANSRFDQWKAGKLSLTTQELNGYTTFKTKCASCHPEPLFTDLSYRNKGLDSLAVDSGRMLITGSPADMGKFKVPSLRNVAES